MISYNPNDYIVPVYNKSSQYNKEDEVNIPEISFMLNGNFNSDIWHSGTMVNGNIEKTNFIWKYGIKRNGTIKGGEDVNNYAFWLGGYNIGEYKSSILENIIWYRGKHQGGEWYKGHWFSLDNNLE